MNPGRPLRLALLWLALCAAAPLARADRLDDQLQTVWEALWDQRGTPQRVLRWDGAVYYRIHGDDSQRHRAHIVRALAAAGAATGITFTDAGERTGVVELDFEVVDPRELRDDEPCATWLQRARSWMLEYVTVKMRSTDAWRCTYHELMHVMGIRGHPSGQSVLSYFPWRRDTFMALDLLLLRAWYSPAMQAGATPLEALEVLTQAVLAQPDLRVPLPAAQQRVQAFTAAAVAQLQALAGGSGEVPSIVLRSGKSSSQHILDAGQQAGYYLGLAFKRGTLVERDPVTAHIWFARAAKAGNEPAQRELEQLEQSLSETDLARARAALEGNQ